RSNTGIYEQGIYECGRRHAGRIQRSEPGPSHEIVGVGHLVSFQLRLRVRLTNDHAIRQLQLIWKELGPSDNRHRKVMIAAEGRSANRVAVRNFVHSFRKVARLLVFNGKEEGSRGIVTLARNAVGIAITRRDLGYPEVKTVRIREAA